jgi:hypothetical protein
MVEVDLCTDDFAMSDDTPVEDASALLIPVPPRVGSTETETARVDPNSVSFITATWMTTSDSMPELRGGTARSSEEVWCPSLLQYCSRGIWYSFDSRPEWYNARDGGASAANWQV